MKRIRLITNKGIRTLIFNKNVLFIFILPFLLGFILYYIKSNFTICALMNFTHIPCPACGLSRAFGELTHFNLINAIRYNIGIVILAPFFLIVVITQLLSVKIKKEIYKFCIKNINIIRISLSFIIIFFLINGIIRIIDHFTHIFGFIDLTPKITILKIIKKIFNIY